MVSFFFSFCTGSIPLTRFPVQTNVYFRSLNKPKKKKTKNGCSLDSKLHDGTDYLASGWHYESFAKYERNSVSFNALSAVRISGFTGNLATYAYTRMLLFTRTYKLK